MAIEVVCCREWVDDDGRVGPCVAVRVSYDPMIVRVRFMMRTDTCDVHNQRVVRVLPGVAEPAAARGVR